MRDDAATATKSTTRRQLRGFFMMVLVTVLGFIAVDALFPTSGTYSWSGDQLREAQSGNWQTAVRPVYFRARGQWLRRGQDGWIDLTPPRPVHTTGISISYLVPGSGLAIVEARAGSRTLATHTLRHRGSGTQGIIRLPVDIAVSETAPIRVMISNRSFTPLTIDRVVIHTGDSGFHWGRWFQALAASVFLAAAFMVAGAAIIRPDVSFQRSWAYIDQLRGAAILLVLLLHTGAYAGLPQFADYESLRRLVYNAGHGVELFYLVSAFTLTLSLLHMLERGGFSYQQFVHNRFVRIVPTFLVIFILCLAAREFIVLSPRPMSLGNILDNVFLAHIFDQQSLILPINHTVWWSIATEFQFYAVLPFIVLALHRAGDKGRLVWLCAMVTAGWTVSILTENMLADVQWAHKSVLYHADVFSLGVAIAVLFGRYQSAKPGGGRDQGPVTATATARNRGWTESFPLRPGPFRHIVLPMLVLVLLGSLAIDSGSWFDGGMPDLLNAEKRLDRSLYLICASLLLGYIFLIGTPRQTGESALANLGILSFVVYLSHIPVLRLVKDHFDPAYLGTEEAYYLYVLVIGLAFSMLIALVVHRLVEAPILLRFRAARVTRTAPWLLKISLGYLAVFAAVSAYRGFTNL